MSSHLPPQASLEHLRKQAKELLRDLREGNPSAIERFGKQADPKQAKLADVQHVLAREYGFASWAKLKDAVLAEPGAADAMDAFIAAVQANQPTRVKQLLERYPELKATLNLGRDEFGFGSTALLHAANEGRRELVDVLLEAGADINKKSDWWAGGFGVLDGDGPLASYLIERGAFVDVHAAASHGMMDRLAELIAGDPQLVYARGGDGKTPLHVARNLEVARFLLDHGADIDARDVDHESTPAQWMVGDRQDIARYLVERGCTTDIMMAAALGDVALVRKHLEQDPASIKTAVTPEFFPMKDPRAGGTIYNWTLDRNHSVYWVARHFGQQDIFDLLLQRSPRDVQLAVAGEVADAALLQSLVSIDPGLIEQLTSQDRTKLVVAAMDNNTAAVAMMLDAGWPVDVRGQHGATALHWAGFHGNADMVRVVLRHNPTIEMKSLEFEGTPLSWTLYGSVHGWHPERGDYAGAAEALIRAGAKAPALGAEMIASEAVRKVLESFNG